MEILVTGSEGFVGKVLVKTLLSQGHYVTGIDRVKTINAQYSFVNCDMSQGIGLQPATFDLVVHCAAAKGDWNISDEEFYNDNVVATENLLSFLEGCTVKRFIHFSTVAIYSRLTTDGGETTKIEPDSVYGKTKLDSETLVKEYAIKTGVSTFILRPSVIYGRHNYANMFNLIQQLNRALPFQINPNGIIKSHVSVRNVVDVVLRFSSLSYSINGIEIYNLTERPYLNLASMIEIICDELDAKQPKVNLPLWLVSVPFRILGLFGKIIKKDTGFTLERLHKFSSSTHYTSEKLWNHMGDQEYSTELELRDMVKWFKSRKK